jgi:LPXTG-motif cell wall-anchored protein
MIKRIVALAVMSVALMAAPAAAQQYPPAENMMTASDTRPCPGQAVTVSAKTFAAGAAVTVKLGDAVVGTPTADANGTVSLEVTIPAGQALGPAQISATGPGGGDKTITVSAAVNVVACNETPPSTTPAGGGTGGGSDLPTTGSDSTMTLVRVGVVLAAIGGLLLAVSAKRRRRPGPVPAT